MYLSVSEISVIVVFLGVVIAYLTFKRAGVKDLIQKTKENTIVTTKLDSITQGVNNIQADMKCQNVKIDSFGDRLIRVEDSVKSSHKRIDDIKGIKREEAL